MHKEPLQRSTWIQKRVPPIGSTKIHNINPLRSTNGIRLDPPPGSVWIHKILLWETLMHLFRPNTTVFTLLIIACLIQSFGTVMDPQLNVDPSYCPNNSKIKCKKHQFRTLLMTRKKWDPHFFIYQSFSTGSFLSIHQSVESGGSIIVDPGSTQKNQYWGDPRFTGSRIHK